MYHLWMCLINFIKVKSRMKVSKKLKYATLLLEKNHYIVFRAIDIERVNQENSVVLCLKFKFHFNNLKMDQVFSFFQIPFFVGMPGFQGKLWTFDKKNKCFQGIYQWESEAFAKMYLESYAVKFVKRKAKNHEVTYNMIYGTDLRHFIKEHPVNLRR